LKVPRDQPLKQALHAAPVGRFSPRNCIHIPPFWAVPRVADISWNGHQHPMTGPPTLVLLCTTLLSVSVLAGDRSPSPFHQNPNLQPDPREIPLHQLIDGPLLSTILITPDHPQPGSPYYMVHASGLLKMLGTLWSNSATGIRVLLLLVLTLSVWLLKAITLRLWRLRLHHGPCTPFK